MKQPEKIWWWEPRWSYRAKLRKEYEQFRNPWLWVRMEIAAVAVIGFVFWLIAKFPEIELPMERIIPLVLVGPFALLGVPMAAFWLIPPQVFLDRHGIVLLHGNSASRMPAKQMRIIRLILSQPGHPLLQVVGNEKTLTCGVESGVDSGQLESLLRDWFPAALVERIGPTPV